jgi:hypothetical protein
MVAGLALLETALLMCAVPVIAGLWTSCAITRRRGELSRSSAVSKSPRRFIATAWANQLELTTTQDTRLEQFVNEFERSPDAPDPAGAVSAVSGTPLG